MAVYYTNGWGTKSRRLWIPKQIGTKVAMVRGQLCMVKVYEGCESALGSDTPTPAKRRVTGNQSTRMGQDDHVPRGGMFGYHRMMRTGSW